MISPSSKDYLRREILSQLKSMSHALRAEASLVICETAANLPAFREASCVALFAPLPSEPDIHPLIEEAWAEGKRVVLPLMLEESPVPELAWHEIKSWEEVVIPGPQGLREPDPAVCLKVPLAEIECVFVPGIAYDTEGFRLGRGGGFYDRFLSLAPTELPRIGLMFAQQMVPLVPREPHDHPLQTIITENGEESFALR